MDLICKIACYVYIPLYPAFEETRCVLWNVGVMVMAHRRGGGGPDDFLEGGGAKFEVTPLLRSCFSVLLHMCEGLI